MELQFVLAGPILRRVDPGLVAVWMAFSEPVELELKVWEGRVVSGTATPHFISSADPPDPQALPPNPGAKAVRIGQRLFIGMVSARIPPASGKSFQPNQLYSYDVIVTRTDRETGLAMGRGLGLGELDFLKERMVSGVKVPPLGYGPLGTTDQYLPSFALPPSELTDLRIAYGSCRRPLYDDGDALAWMDDYLVDKIGDPRARIHQLFLGGDQIYADDVSRIMMPHVIDLGIELIGREGPDETSPAIERVTVDQVLALQGPATEVNPASPTASYKPETLAETVAAGDLPAGPEQFPPGNRLALTQYSAQFTSEDGASHVITFGEFAALYLMVWNPACWGEIVTGATVQLLDNHDQARNLRWLETLDADQRIVFTTPHFPEVDFAKYRVEDVTKPEPEIEDPQLAHAVYPGRIPEYLFEPPDPPEPPEELTPKQRDKKEADRKEAATKAKADLIRDRLNKHRINREFLLGLGRVQRVLANVPTYMILDDHDLTDDLFISPMWRHRVLGSALGQTILTNGMLAYALFQDWGNDPRRYDQVTDPHTTANPDLSGKLPGDLLDFAPIYFPKGLKKGPDPETFKKFAEMCGHTAKDNQPTGDGRYLPVKPPLTWHFSYDGPKHKVVALDNRTRRSYASSVGPPGNVSPEALLEQLPQLPLAHDQQVLIVIAPLQVIGPPVLDDIVSPSIYRIKDMVKFNKISKDKLSGLRNMPGTDPDALETWALEPLAFEFLLKRLSEFQRVVLLSGDVHNSSGNLMSYWRGESDTPARFAQFTSSGFKNVMPVYLRALDQSAMLLQQLLRVGLGVVRLGWEKPADGLVQLPPGRTVQDLPASTRSKLLRSPVLLTDHGWIDDNKSGEPQQETLRSRLVHAPDWRWKVRPLLDERPDDKRPRPIWPLEIDEALIETEVNDPGTLLDALQRVAARHQAALDRMRNTRQMMFRSNFGICRFEAGTASDTIDAIHEIWTQAINPVTNLPVLGPYLLQRAPLGPENEDPPRDLRAAAIVAKPVRAATQP